MTQYKRLVTFVAEEPDKQGDGVLEKALAKLFGVDWRTGVYDLDGLLAELHDHDELRHELIAEAENELAAP